MKKLKNKIIIMIIAILALFIIFSKPIYGLLNIDDNPSAVETQLGTDLKLGIEEKEEPEKGKTVDDYIKEEEKKKLLEDAKKLITIDSMLFNEEPLVDVNFFTDSEAIKEIKEKNPKAFIIQIREGIKMWYYIIRNVAIMVMVVVLLYTTIRIFLNIYAESPENKARYKEMMLAWTKALATLVVMHLVIYTVIAFNSDVVETIKNVAQIDDPRIQNLNVILLERALDIRLSVAFPSTILYVLVTFLTMKFFFVYLKRFILVLILIVSGPFITIKTAYESTGKSVSKAYSKWFYDLLINVMEQSVHALFYALFVRGLFEGAMQDFIGFLLFWFVLKSMLKLSASFIKLFKFNSKSGSIGSMPMEKNRGLVKFGEMQLAARAVKSYIGFSAKPAKFITTTVGAAAFSAGIAGTRLIANQLSINQDLSNPNTELIRDRIDRAVLGNEFVRRQILKDETGEETEKLLEIRKDARRETDSSKYSKELSKKYINEKVGNFTASIGATTKISAMKAARILGIPFALIKDLTDGQDISFSTLELLKMTDWRKVKKDYEKKQEKSKEKTQKYKKKITAHTETIKDKAKIRSEYKDLLAERERKRKNNNNIINGDGYITADEIKRRLKRINYLDINANSLDKVIKQQMAELNIETKEDLTSAKIDIIFDKVVEKSKLDYKEREATLEKLSHNRFVDEEETNSTNALDKNVNPMANIIRQVNLNNIDPAQNINNNNNNDNNNNDDSRNNNQDSSNAISVNNYDENKNTNNMFSEEENNISNVVQNQQIDQENNLNSRNENEPPKDIHDISEARARREGSRYIAEEFSKILTSIIAEDENIEKIGNNLNALKDSSDKRKSKLNINKFIDNL